MNRTTLRIALLAGTAFALAAALAAGPLAPTAAAQSKTGTTFGQFLLIEPSARFAGMGNAGASFDVGLDAAYYNPAAAAGGQGYEAQFTHSAWFADISYGYAALSLPVRKLGTFYGSATVLNSGDIDVRTVTQPLGTGERYHVTDLAATIGYAREVGRKVAIGLAFNYVQETIWNSSASTMTFNLGTQYRASENGLQIGASMSNFGTDARFDGIDLRITYDQNPDINGDNGTLPGEKYVNAYSVPVLFRVGAGMPFRLGHEAVLRAAIDAYHANDNPESVSLGAELQMREIVSLRAGWQNLFLSDAEMGPTLGAGFRGRLDTVKLRFDYAWADYGRLGDTHRFTLGVRF